MFTQPGELAGGWGVLALGGRGDPFLLAAALMGYLLPSAELQCPQLVTVVPSKAMFWDQGPDSGLANEVRDVLRSSPQAVTRRGAGLGLGPPALSCLCVCRWSVMAYETKLPRQASSSTTAEDFSEGSEVLPGARGRSLLSYSPVSTASPAPW